MYVTPLELCNFKSGICLTEGKLWEFPLFLEPYFFELNRFRGKDVVATLFIPGVEFSKCERTLKNYLRITIRGSTRTPRSWKMEFNWGLSSEASRQPTSFASKIPTLLRCAFLPAVSGAMLWLQTFLFAFGCSYLYGTGLSHGVGGSMGLDWVIIHGGANLPQV